MRRTLVLFFLLLVLLVAGWTAVAQSSAWVDVEDGTYDDGDGGFGSIPPAEPSSEQRGPLPLHGGMLNNYGNDYKMAEARARAATDELDRAV